MQLQKFVGDSMPVVLSNLKDALGSDAIILANRRVGDHIEIIATGSLDESSIDNAQVFQSGSSDSITGNGGNNNSARDQVETNALDSTTAVRLNSEKPAPQSFAASLEHISSAHSVDANVEPSITNDHDNRIEENDDQTDVVDAEHSESLSDTAGLADKNPSVDPVLTNAETTSLKVDATVTAAVTSAIEECTGPMADSIASRINIEVDEKLTQFHTTMNQRLSQLEVNMWGEKDPIKSKHLQTLLEIGLGAELAVTLVNRVTANSSYEEAIRSSLSDLANTLPVASDNSLTHDGITFVTGPSGSGKTTTLLKLATHKLALAGQDSVIMICADAKRTGVFEALTAHGKLMGVPVVSASNQRELQELLAFYSHKELVLVDQPLQDEFVDYALPETDTEDFNARSVRHLLVLPATIQSSVAESVVTEFSKHASARCVITHLDRPCRVGELFTTVIRHNLRVAYWSDCGDVATPLNTASATTLVAAAMAMGRRLVPSEDDRYLMNLIHPRFSASVIPMLRAKL